MLEALDGIFPGPAHKVSPPGFCLPSQHNASVAYYMMLWLQTVAIAWLSCLCFNHLLLQPYGDATKHVISNGLS